MLWSKTSPSTVCISPLRRLATTSSLHPRGHFSSAAPPAPLSLWICWCLPTCLPTLSPRCFLPVMCVPHFMWHLPFPAPLGLLGLASVVLERLWLQRRDDRTVATRMHIYFQCSIIYWWCCHIYACSQIFFLGALCHFSRTIGTSWIMCVSVCSTSKPILTWPVRSQDLPVVEICEILRLSHSPTPVTVFPLFKIFIPHFVRHSDATCPKNCFQYFSISSCYLVHKREFFYCTEGITVQIMLLPMTAKCTFRFSSDSLPVLVHQVYTIACIELLPRDWLISQLHN